MCSMGLEYLPKKQPVPLCLMLVENVETLKLCQSNILITPCIVELPPKNSFKWLDNVSNSFPTYFPQNWLDMILRFLLLPGFFSPNKRKSFQSFRLRHHLPWVFFRACGESDPVKRPDSSKTSSAAGISCISCQFFNEKLVPFSPVFVCRQVTDFCVKVVCVCGLYCTL